MKEKGLEHIQLLTPLSYMMIGMTEYLGRINSLHTCLLNRWASTLSSKKERAQ